MMDQIVSNFIEKNIKYIEKQQWYFLFLAWYSEACSLSFEDEPRLFSELVQVLSEANIASDRDTIFARTNIIRDLLLRDIEEWEDSEDTTIRIYEFYNLLCSLLGLCEETVHNIAVKILKDKGYNLFDKDRGVTKL